MVLADSHGISRAPCYSGYSHALFYFRLQDFHLLWCSFQLLCLAFRFVDDCPTTPEVNTSGLGCFPFAHHYLGNRYCFLFLQLLRCFNSLGSPHQSMYSIGTYWVAPFGHLRLNACFQLPGAYRRSPRPSSPLCA